MNKHNLSLSSFRRSRLLSLLGVTLLLIGTLLLLAGGLWSRHQNVAARSYLDELNEKVALITVAEGESAPVLSLSDSETVGKATQSATEATPTYFTQPDRDRTSKVSLVSAPGGLQSFSVGESAGVSVGEGNFQIPVRISEEAIRPAASTTPEIPAPAIQTELEQEVASLASVVPSIPPTSTFSSVKLMRVDSREEVFTFTAVDLATLPPLGSLSPATRIRIPAIDLVSPGKSLALLNHRGLWLFSIPKDFVGQIPTTGNPGESARGWYMGHQSDVFERLPEIVSLVLEGKTVDVILETEKEAYLYRVSGRPVILPSSEYDGGYFHANLYAAVPEIVLVTCVPPKRRDSRLLVTARLVGVGHSP